MARADAGTTSDQNVILSLRSHVLLQALGYRRESRQFFVVAMGERRNMSVTFWPLMSLSCASLN